MSELNHLFKTTRLSIWLLACTLILAATSVYAAGDQRPLAAVDILGSPDAAVDGKLAVGAATPGNKALTVAGVIDFMGAGTVHNYFTQGPGNNMQIRSNVDESNSVGNSSYAQWNMVMGASLDVFSIRRSPAGSTYNEDALFWIEGDTGNIGIAKVDTSNSASIPFTVQARLHVETDFGDGIWGVSTDTSASGAIYGVYGRSDSIYGRGVYGEVTTTIGENYGVYGLSESSQGRGVFGIAGATNGVTAGVRGESFSSDGSGVLGFNQRPNGDSAGVTGLTYSSDGRGVEGLAYPIVGSGTNYGVYGYANATSGDTRGAAGISESDSGIGVEGIATATSGSTNGIYGQSDSSAGRGVFGYAVATSGTTYGVYGQSDSTDGVGTYGWASATSGAAYGVFGESDSVNGAGVYGYATATLTGGSVTFGVFGESASTNGVGVYGEVNATTGNTEGVSGVSHSTSGTGVSGHAYASSGPAVGVAGYTNSTGGYGVLGSASATSGIAIGVSGQTVSTEGSGVWGYADAPSGTTNGVWGENYSSTGRGVFGYIHATTGLNYAVMGATSSSSGYDFYAAGSGTDYGPFTGAHEVMLSDSFPEDFKLGMIVSATGEAKVRETADGGIDLSSTLPTVKLAHTVDDIAVLGVVVAEVTLPEDHWYAVKEGERFGTVNALGEGRVWVSNINGDIKPGDYITTSTIPGYGQRQGDGYLHNFTLAKATEMIDWDMVTDTVTFNGEEYKVYLLAVVYTSG